MQIAKQATDQAILLELGSRLARGRLERNFKRY